MFEKSGSTVQEIEATTRETLKSLSKMLSDLAEQENLHGVSVDYQGHRPLEPQYETMSTMPIFKRFMGLKQTGPVTYQITVIDRSNEGMLIPAEKKA